MIQFLRPIQIVVISQLLLWHVSGQSPTGYITADEFSNASCEEFLARSDQFFNFLKRFPTGNGFVVITGDGRFLRRKLTYENWWFGAVEFRNFDQSRVKVVRGNEEGDLTVRFLILPSILGKSPYDEVKWNFHLARGTKAFLYHDDLEQICASPKFARSYKEYLDANPDARGHIVIYAKNRRMYRRGLTEAKSKVGDISPYRLRYFYKRTNTNDPWAEYWLVPKRK